MGTVIYRINWLGAAPEHIDAYIDITDMDTYVEGSDPEYRALTGTGMKIIRSHDEDVHDAVYTRMISFGFINTNNQYLHTFSRGHDKRWHTRFWYRWFDTVFETWDTHEVFVGFLNMEYNSEPYLPKGHPVTLTANDGLADLQTIDFSDFDSNRPTGKQSLKDMLCWILKKTGYERNINIMDNLFEVHHETKTINALRSPWAQAYQDMKTFEGSEIGKTINCMDVLKLLLKDRLCRLYFYNGSWWVNRLDELKNTKVHYTTYDADGVVIDGTIDEVITKSISAAPPTAQTDDPTFINRTGIVKLRRPRKKVKFTVDYNLPLEIVCNINFERGAFNSPYTIDGDHVAYDIECWSVKRGLGSSATTISTAAIIRRIYQDGYEKERYAILFNPGSGSTAPLNYLESEGVEVVEKDKFIFSFDWRWPTDASSGSSLSEAVAMIRLEGDDGSHWTLDDDGKWYLSDVNWTTFLKTIDINWIPDNVDEREWRSTSVSANGLPVTGKVYIMLFTQNQNATAIDNVDTYFDNLSFTYKPFVNGGYSNYTGEHHQVSVDVNNKNYVEDRPLVMHDNSRKLIKGAYFYKDGSDNFQTTAAWDDWALARDGVAGVGETRIGKWLAWNLWDMYRREMNIFSPVEFRGMNIEQKYYLDTHHPIIISGSTPATLNKKFLVVPVEQDWYRMQWRAVLHEIHDLVEDAMRDFGASGAEYEFKYLSR